jgi:hypothetical protein
LKLEGRDWMDLRPNGMGLGRGNEEWLYLARVCDCFWRRMARRLKATDQPRGVLRIRWSSKSHQQTVGDHVLNHAWFSRFARCSQPRTNTFRDLNPSKQHSGEIVPAGSACLAVCFAGSLAEMRDRVQPQSQSPRREPIGCPHPAQLASKSVGAVV